MQVRRCPVAYRLPKASCVFFDVSGANQILEVKSLELLGVEDDDEKQASEQSWLAEKFEPILHNQEIVNFKGVLG